MADRRACIYMCEVDNCTDSSQTTGWSTGAERISREMPKTSTLGIPNWWLLAESRRQHSSVLSKFRIQQSITLSRSVKLTLFILLHHHISKFPMCIWSTFPSSQVSAPRSALLQTQYFSSFFLKFQSNFLVKRAFFLLYTTFSTAIMDLISREHFFHLLSCYVNSLNNPHSNVAFDL